MAARTAQGLRHLWSRGWTTCSSLDLAPASVIRHASTAGRPGPQSEGPSGGSGEDIDVDSPLQDLFSRLSKDQTPAAAPPQPSTSNKQYREAARPRPSSPPPLGKHQLDEPPAWSAEDFVTAAWAFGRARHYHRLWHKMASVLVQYPDRYLYRMTPEGLTMLAVGYAQVKVQEPQLFREIANHTRRTIRGFTPSQLSQLVWAFAEVHHQGLHSHVGVIIRQAEETLGSFTARDVVRLLTSLNELNELTLPLLSRFLHCMSGRLPELKTPLVLKALVAVSDSVSRQVKVQQVEPRVELSPVKRLLHEVMPLLVERAVQTMGEWRGVAEGQGGGEEGEGAGGGRPDEEALMLRMRREWPDWDRVRQLYSKVAHEDDAVRVHDAVAALEQLRFSAEEPGGMLRRQAREEHQLEDEGGTSKVARPAAQN